MSSFATSPDLTAFIQPYISLRNANLEKYNAEFFLKELCF